jgi:hypothetical protein
MDYEVSAYFRNARQYLCLCCGLYGLFVFQDLVNDERFVHRVKATFGPKRGRRSVGFRFVRIYVEVDKA